MSSRSQSQKAASDRISWPYVLGGFGSLVLGAYFDNIRGPLLPSVAQELGLAFADSGVFFAVGYAAATTVSFGLNAALNRFSERSVMLVVAATGLAATAMAPFVKDRASLMVLAALIGATVSVLGTMANVLILEGTPVSRQSRMLSGLHALYGLGSMLAATIVGAALRSGAHWTALYNGAIPAILAYMLFAILKVGKHAKAGTKTIQSNRLNGLQLLAVLLFSVYVVGEVTLGQWLVTYLVTAAKLPQADATTYLSAVYFLMMVSRAVCFLTIKPAYERIVLALSLVIPITAFAVGYGGMPAAFALTGLFGPFYPIFLARIARLFPKQWRAVTIWSIVGMNVLIGLGNISLGAAADAIGIRRAYLIPPGLLTAALALLLVFFLCERRRPAAAN